MIISPQHKKEILVVMIVVLLIVLGLMILDKPYFKKHSKDIYPYNLTEEQIESLRSERF
tara:strand:- start:717 stop:893 length:177 start_codon:yes stop_codon:yes gene_type:complete